MAPLVGVAASPQGGLLFAILGGLGVFILTQEVKDSPAIARRSSVTVQQRLADAGLTVSEAGALVGGSAAVAALVAFALFGAVLVAAAAGLAGAILPIATIRARMESRRQEAREEWPHIIEMIRIQAAAQGLSIPAAVIAATPEVPEMMRPAFVQAARVWQATGDMQRMMDALATALDDAMADQVCETLVMAHQIGGSTVDARLRALASNRRRDISAAREAGAHLAGARFARAFVLVVPLGMAIVGLSIADGRASYQTLTGQLLVGLAGVVLAGCWFWASALLSLPTTERVLDSVPEFSGNAGARR